MGSGTTVLGQTQTKPPWPFRRNVQKLGPLQYNRASHGHGLQYSSHVAGAGMEPASRAPRKVWASSPPTLTAPWQPKKSRDLTRHPIIQSKGESGRTGPWRMNPHGRTHSPAMPPSRRASGGRRSTATAPLTRDAPAPQPESRLRLPGCRLQ